MGDTVGVVRLPCLVYCERPIRGLFLTSYLFIKRRVALNRMNWHEAIDFEPFDEDDVPFGTAEDEHEDDREEEDEEEDGVERREQLLQLPSCVAPKPSKGEQARDTSGEGSNGRNTEDKMQVGRVSGSKNWSTTDGVRCANCC